MILVRYRNLTREHEIEASEDLGETIIGHISLSDITKSQSSIMYVKKCLKISTNVESQEYFIVQAMYTEPPTLKIILTIG